MMQNRYRKQDVGPVCAETIAQQLRGLTGAMSLIKSSTTAKRKFSVGARKRKAQNAVVDQTRTRGPSNSSSFYRPGTGTRVPGDRSVLDCTSWSPWQLDTGHALARPEKHMPTTMLPLEDLRLVSLPIS